MKIASLRARLNGIIKDLQNVAIDRNYGVAAFTDFSVVCLWQATVSFL